MSLEKTKQLLRTFRIVPNKLLGQNFMVESSVYPKLCEYACLSNDDVVLDAGAGLVFSRDFCQSDARQFWPLRKTRGC